MNKDQIESRLDELYYELGNRPRNFWTGTKFTPEEARAHYEETKRLLDKFFRLTGTFYTRKRQEDPHSFSRHRYLSKHYPGGVSCG